LGDEINLDYEVGIVGAGFGGIIAALALRRAGRNSFVILERAAAVGGVWRDNVYPGCACDVRSHLYSMAGQSNPSWTTSYASQPEILDYLKDVVAREELAKHIRFGANISEIQFLEQHGCWQVYEDGRPSCRVRMMILALGPHSRPSMPGIPGLATFRGSSFHSSRWDRSLDLTGKRVAVIGTGASAIQIVPNIAPTVSKLFLFQRTPAWIIPRGDRKISAFETWLFRRLPPTQLLSRAAIYWLTEFVGLAFQGNATLNRLLTRVALRKLVREVRDPETRKHLTPSYKIGCKRVLISDDFYPAVNRSNVHLVTEEIQCITPEGIQTTDGLVRELDAIVYATGFIVADTDQYLRVVGRGGRVMTEEWNENGAEAHLGLHVAGFPNLGILLGPNSGLGHSSALHVIESQMKYVVEYLAKLDRLGPNDFLDVKPEVQRQYNLDIQQRLKRTSWAAGCRSWYLDRNGRNTTVFPGLTWQYRVLMRHFRPNDYDVVTPHGGLEAQDVYSYSRDSTKLPRTADSAGSRLAIKATPTTTGSKNNANPNGK
jgi:cation diffusion facilitator CzcD-associated flavoprotein CzcO